RRSRRTIVGRYVLRELGGNALTHSLVNLFLTEPLTGHRPISSVVRRSFDVTRSKVTVPSRTEYKTRYAPTRTCQVASGHHETSLSNGRRCRAGCSAWSRGTRTAALT